MEDDIDALKGALHVLGVEHVACDDLGFDVRLAMAEFPGVPDEDPNRFALSGQLARDRPTEATRRTDEQMPHVDLPLENVPGAADVAV